MPGAKISQPSAGDDPADLRLKPWTLVADMASLPVAPVESGRQRLFVRAGSFSHALRHTTTR
jgi:hypothetical protein